MSRHKRTIACNLLIVMIAAMAFMHVGMKIDRFAKLPRGEPFKLDRWSQVRWKLPAERVYRVLPDLGISDRSYNFLLAPRHVDQESATPWVLLDAAGGAVPPQNAEVVEDLGDDFFLLREERAQ